MRGVSPGPRIDIFSREKREAFDQYEIDSEARNTVAENDTAASNPGVYLPRSTPF